MTNWPDFFREHLTTPKASLAKSQKHARELVRHLDPDETQILSRIVKGWGSQGIAAELDIDDATFEARKQRLLLKLNVLTTTDLFRIAVYADLDR